MKTLITTLFLFLISFSISAQTNLDSGLVAYYSFNGNALDGSGNGNDGSLINGVSFESDRGNIPNQAIRFDKSLSQYVDVPNSTTLQIDSTISFSFWLKRNTLGGQDQVLNKGGDWPYGNCNYGLVFSDWSLCFIYNGGYYYVGSPGVPQDYNWHHYAVTATNGTSEVHFYVDGVEKASMFGGLGDPVINLYSQSTSDLYISGVNYFSNNSMDELKIYNRILTANEIESLYSNLVAYYPFNGNANDESGNNNNGTVLGATLTQDRFGIPGKAYYFNGTSDFISIPDNPNLFSDELTISWWYKMTEILGGERVVIGWVDGGHRYQQFFNGGQLSYLNGYNLNQSGILFNPIYGLNELNVWKNVVVTYKKLTETTSTTSIYVDGELKQTDNHNLAMDYVPGINFFIGKNHNGNFFNGYLDDFRIYNRVLNDNEIVALYNDSTTYFPVLIDSVYPHQNSSYLTKNESIKIYFSEPMDKNTFTYYNLNVHGNLTGKYDRNYIYQSSSNTLEIQPTEPFKYGEQITVTLDSTIRSVSGYNLSPYAFQFNIKPEKGSVKFAVADSFQLNFSPQNIVSGDFNNDGKVDVIVSNYDSSKYTILLNNGSGGFILGEELAGPFKPYSISFTDIDNDRDLDMIVSTSEQNQIRVLRGTGQGTFAWILPVIDVVAPVSTCPGDFDGDGDNDFVALCNSGNAIFYKNDGTGLFSQSGSVAINVPASIRNIVGDIDNDGDLDIIGGTSDYWGVFKILINDGTGNFTFTGGPYLGPYPDELAGGDFDGDYDLDFVYGSWYLNGISLILNNGQGNYNDNLNLGNVGGQSRNPIVGDFDGDGDLDFAVAFNLYSDFNIGIAKNNGHPNYELYLSDPILGLKGLATGDFDNNGSVDLVGISNTTNQIKFLKNCLDSLVAYYPFDGNAQDQSGNINDGVNHNGIFSKDRFGNDNSSMLFTGNDSYVEGTNPGNNLPAGNSPRTITAWIKENSFHPWGNNIFHYGLDQSAPTNFHLYTTDVIRFGNGYDYGVVAGTTPIVDSTWHFVAGVYEGGTQHIAKVYVDGKLDAAGTLSTEPNTILGSNWKIGRFMTGSNNFDGDIDELKIYNFALTGQEIFDLYKATTTAPTLLYPGNDSTLINPYPTIILDWDSTVSANHYRLLIASDSLFNTIVKDTITNTSSFDFYYEFFIYFDNLYWKVRTINDGGIGPWSETNRFNIMLTDVEDETQFPTEFALMQNYPNPFNPSTVITYHLPKASNVKLIIYDVLGNEIATLVDEYKPAGVYEINFNSNKLASGIYLYKLQAGGFVETRKMILMR